MSVSVSVSVSTPFVVQQMKWSFSSFESNVRQEKEEEEEIDDETRSCFGSHWFAQSLFLVDFLFSLVDLLFDFLLFARLDLLSHCADQDRTLATL